MISVIIPFCDRHELFAPLFEGLKQIDEPDVELLFVNNNSQDEARHAVEAFRDEILANHRNLSCRIIFEPKPGAAAARNAGFAEAKGDYVYFFDSDDGFSPEFLPRARSLIEKTGADAIATQVRFLLPSGRTRKRKIIRSTNAKYQILANNFCTPSLLLRKAGFLNPRVSISWNEDLFYWNDWEWAFRVLLNKPNIAWLDGVYHNICIHPKSITGASYTAAVDKILKAHVVVEDDISASQLSDAEKLRLMCALSYRRALYAGHIKREGSGEGALRVLKTVAWTSLSKWGRIKAKALYWMSGWGVPGLWRLC